MKILRVDASARTDGSHSRALSAYFVEALRSRLPALEVDHVDLARDTPAHFGAPKPGAVALPEADHTPRIPAATKPSGTFVSRALAADALVIGTPSTTLGCRRP